MSNNIQPMGNMSKLTKKAERVGDMLESLTKEAKRREKLTPEQRKAEEIAYAAALRKNLTNAAEDLSGLAKSAAKVAAAARKNVAANKTRRNNNNNSNNSNGSPKSVATHSSKGSQGSRSSIVWRPRPGGLAGKLAGIAQNGGKRKGSRKGHTTRRRRN